MALNNNDTTRYKLTYFDIRGLGECIKYIFAYKNIKYDLETVILFTGKSEWFEKVKDEMPFGQLPILDIDEDERLCQSIAICYYLGGKHGLDGGSLIDDAQLIAIASATHDYHMRAAVFYYERLEEKKEILRQRLLNQTMPFYLNRFENMLKKSGDYFYKKLTWLDFYIVTTLEHINGMLGADQIAGVYPHLEEHMKRIWNLPGVKEYIATRPASNR